MSVDKRYILIDRKGPGSALLDDHDLYELIMAIGDRADDNVEAAEEEPGAAEEYKEAAEYYRTLRQKLINVVEGRRT